MPKYTNKSSISDIRIKRKLPYYRKSVNTTKDIRNNISKITINEPIKYIRNKTVNRKGSDIRNTLIKSMQQTKKQNGNYLDDPFLLALIDEMRGSKKTRDVFDYHIKNNYQTFTNKTKTKILLDATVRMQEEAVPSSQDWIVLLSSLNMSNSNSESASVSGLRNKSRRKGTQKKKITLRKK